MDVTKVALLKYFIDVSPNIYVIRFFPFSEVREDYKLRSGWRPLSLVPTHPRRGPLSVGSVPSDGRWITLDWTGQVKPAMMGWSTHLEGAHYSTVL